MQAYKWAWQVVKVAENRCAAVKGNLKQEAGGGRRGQTSLFWLIYVRIIMRKLNFDTVPAASPPNSELRAPRAPSAARQSVIQLLCLSARPADAVSKSFWFKFKTRFEKQFYNFVSNLNYFYMAFCSFD